jgi:hypothetical protein
MTRRKKGARCHEEDDPTRIVGSFRCSHGIGPRKGLKNILNFPLGTGKKWKSVYSSTPLFGFFGGAGRFVEDYSESYTVQGWENVEIRAGKFKALRLKYKRLTTGCSHPMQVGIGIEVKNQYWYSPAVKYFVKCEYDQKLWKGAVNWELVSLKLK